MINCIKQSIQELNNNNVENAFNIINNFVDTHPIELQRLPVKEIDML